MTMAKGLTRTARRDLMAAWTAQLQDEITTFFERLDGRHFSEAAWDRQGGGGGRSRLLSDGAIFEKAGVNRALVEGILPPEAAKRLGGNVPPDATPYF
ncbi:MAG: coproporphyrinogen III oxidase, partial [Gemmatimonadota bacterium]